MNSPNHRPLTLLQISDLHLLHHSNDTLLGVNTAYYFKQVLQHAHQQQQFDLIVVTGDLAQQPCQESYLQIYDTLATYNTPTLCLPGNHDDWQLMQTVLNQGGVSCKKQFIFGNWQLISLNSQKLASDKGWLAATELQFLTHCLQALPEHYAIIALHHHCIPTQSAWLDTMLIGNSAQLFTQLANFPLVKVIFHGHIHQVLDAIWGNIRVLGTPSTCFQFKPYCTDFTLDTIAPGYRLLQLYPTGNIDTQIFRLPTNLIALKTNADGY